MSHALPAGFNPELDLLLEREIDVPVELVWKAWTTPEHVCKWFCPAPWSVSACEIDLRPGGIFATTMRSPDGDEMPNIGCYLEVEPLKKLVFTDALLPGFRPTGGGFMTGILLLEPTATGTRYRAMALHANAETRQKHEEMGFAEGWSAALDQLVAMVKTW